MYSKTSQKNIAIFFLASAAAVLFVTVIYLAKIYNINKYYNKKYRDNSAVALRKFPYPYRAALSISNDADNIETLEEYLEIHKFLNTKEMTSMGNGVGLEIGNSFLPYEPRTDAISYYSGDVEATRTLIALIRKGSVDIIHSYGKKSDFTRKDAVAMLEELDRNGCRVEVWIDHARSTGNLGDDVTSGFGDHKDSPAYHADLTLAHGIRFAWLGRVTMITGQSTDLGIKTFADIFDSDHPVASLANIAKEFAKHFLGVFGSKKYEMHGSDDLVRVTTLDDGQRIFEFIRFDNYWEGVGTGATNKRLAYVISKRTLDHLKESGGYAIVYTHFGKNSDCSQFVCKETQEALRSLSNEYRSGNVYVSNTSNLLNYYVTHKYLDWFYEVKGDEATIHIKGVSDPLLGNRPATLVNLQGMTFYVPDNARKILIYVGGLELDGIKLNPADHSGRVSVSIPPMRQ